MRITGLQHHEDYNTITTTVAGFSDFPAQKPWIYTVYWELKGVPSPHSSPLMVLMLVNTP